MQCTDDDNRSDRNVCNMPFVSFSLAVSFIIRLFRTSAFRVPNLSSVHEIIFQCFLNTGSVFISLMVVISDSHLLFLRCITKRFFSLPSRIFQCSCVFIACEI